MGNVKLVIKKDDDNQYRIYTQLSKQTSIKWHIGKNLQKFFIIKFNAKFDNNNKIIFLSRYDARSALDWIESYQLSKKLIN
ncbi:MAG: hypothetical protein ACOCP8_07420 [archaeon]